MVTIQLLKRPTHDAQKTTLQELNSYIDSAIPVQLYLMQSCCPVNL